MGARHWGGMLAVFAVPAAAAPAHALTTPTLDEAGLSVSDRALRAEAAAPLEAPRLRPELRLAPQGVANAAIARVLIGAVQVEGAGAVAPAAFAPAIERYVGRTLSPDELRELTTEIADTARAEGFGLATAWVPEQRIWRGVLRVRLDEGRIDALEVRGSGRAAVEPLLRAVADGAPLRTDALERQLLLADDVPGVALDRARLERRDGRNFLVVTARRERVSASAGVDNWGSADAGSARARLSVDVNGLLARGDRLRVDTLVTPLDPRGFGLVRGEYATAIGRGGTELSVAALIARSKARRAQADPYIQGDSSEIEAALRHPLIRTRAGSLWAGLFARVQDTGVTRDGAALRKERVVTAAASLQGVRRLFGGRLAGRAVLVKGLGLFGATRGGDPLASRADADGRFTKLELGAEYEHRLGGGLSLAVQAEGQVAPQPLLANEELGLGGRFFGRAWNFRELSGDQGAAGAAELRYDWKGSAGGIQGAQLYAYADAGQVGDHGARARALASAGLGVRLALGDGSRIGLETGLPLTPGADRAKPRRPRFSLSVTRDF